MISDKNTLVEKLFKAGAHFGLSKSRRHPSTKGFIFGAKNKTEIFDLEKTEASLAKALEFIRSVAAAGKQILVVSGKSEALAAVKDAAGSTGQPYVAGRWIGGTLTNFGEIRKRIEKYENRQKEKEKGELAKYTKKERLLIDREIENLEIMFGGIVSMKEKPGALVVIDPKREEIAVLEARQMNVPVVALASNDCDITMVNYPVPANDSSRDSVKFFLDEVASAYNAGKVLKPEAK